MDEFTITILLLGDEKVGKTTFLSRISGGAESLDGPAPSPFAMLRDIDQPFIFELRNRKYKYRLEFHDTSSPENWRLLQPDLVLICYDISQRRSLINMQEVWIKEVHSTFKNSNTLPVVVVGLKRDLRRSEDDPNNNGEPPIYPQEGYKVSQAMRADKYVECSAATGELLKLAFEEICKTAAQTVTEEGGQSEGACVVL